MLGEWWENDGRMMGEDWVAVRKMCELLVNEGFDMFRVLGNHLELVYSMEIENWIIDFVCKDYPRDAWMSFFFPLIDEERVLAKFWQEFWLVNWYSSFFFTKRYDCLGLGVVSREWVMVDDGRCCVCGSELGPVDWQSLGRSDSLLYWGSWVSIMGFS